MSQGTFLENLIARTASQLQRWHGHPARMLELTRSHATLRILVGDDPYGTNLVIACLDPQSISGPTRWENSAIVLEVANPESDPPAILIVDEQNGLRVIAETVEVKENVRW